MASPRGGRLGVVALLGALAAHCALGDRAASAAPPLCSTPEACFARFVEGQRDVVSVRARFSQVKRIALLRDPLESSGSFEFERGRGVRWEVEKPEPMVVEISGEQLRAGPPGELRRVDGASPDLLAQMAGLFTGGARPDQFAIAPGRSEGSFRLEPRDPALARVVAAVELEIDPAAHAPRSVEIEEASGDRTRIELTDVRVERRSEAGSTR